MSDMINATLDFAYFDARDARCDVPAQVMLDASGMTLIAPDVKGDNVLWHGERRGQGHYVLIAPDARMEATLHRFADSTVLEGFWRNERERGFWRLHLPADAVIPQEIRVAPPSAEAVGARARPIRKRSRRAA